MGRVVGLVVGRQGISLTGHGFAIEQDIRARGDDGRWHETIMIGAKISEQGIHSLTPAERKELEALRERRRKGR